MASAAPNAPYRNGPPAPKRARHSFQIASMRATSAGRRRRAHAHYRPPDIHRQMPPQRAEIRRASPTRSRAHGRAPPAGCGHKRRPGNFSAKYSRIASDSQTRMSPSISVGTLPAPPNAVTRSLKSGAFERDQRFFECNSGDLHRQPGPERPGRVILIANDQLKSHGAHLLAAFRGEMSTVFWREQERGSSNQAGHHSEKRREKNRRRGKQCDESGLDPSARYGLGSAWRTVSFLSRLARKRERHFG